MAQPFLYFEIGARAQVEADDGTRALAEPMRDILAGDNQILIPVVLAAKHDVRVRMAGIAMVGSDPVELGAEILFHLRHQSTHERLKVGMLVAILGRDDEAELVAVVAATLDECRAIRNITIGRVKTAGCAFRGGAVSLDIAQVRPAGRDTLRPELDQARLDYDAAAAETGVPISAAEDATDARAPSDPTAVEATGPHARRSAGSGRSGDDSAKKFPRLIAGRSASTKTPKPRLELVAAHGRSTPTRGPDALALR